MMGQTGEQDKKTMQYENVIYMPCTAENGFFPDYASAPRADVVYLCSPKYVLFPLYYLCLSTTLLKTYLDFYYRGYC